MAPCLDMVHVPLEEHLNEPRVISCQKKLKDNTQLTTIAAHSEKQDLDIATILGMIPVELGKVSQTLMASSLKLT